MKSAIAGVLLAVPLLANAYTWNQTIDFNPNVQFTTGSSYTFTQDLKTDGFNPSTDTITGYDVTIDVINDRGLADLIYIDQPGNFSSDSLALLWNWSYASLETNASYQGIASLNSDGLLNVTVASWYGNFSLDKSTLIASGTQGGINSNSASHPVPEPASVALLAAGLLGIAVMRRKGNKTS